MSRYACIELGHTKEIINCNLEKLPAESRVIAIVTSGEQVLAIIETMERAWMPPRVERGELPAVKPKAK